MRLSLRFQLLAPLVTILLGVVAMSIWAAVASAHHAREQINNQVRQIVRTLNESSFPLTERVLEMLKGFTGADYLLEDSNGSRVSTLHPPMSDLLPPATEEKDCDTIQLEQRVEWKGQSYLYTGVRLQKGRHAGATLYIFYPESLWQETVWQAVRPSLIFGVLFGLAAIAFTIILAQRLTRRVRALEQQTRLIAEGDFSAMRVPRRNDELRDLIESINKMAARLAAFQDTIKKNERMRLLGQVGGGLAHQLRNGVTGARLAVQVHARECQDKADAESLDVALRQLALVEMHLKRFLALGRDEGGEHAPCSLPRLLDDHIALLRPQCRHAHVDLRWTMPEAPEDIIVHGNAEQLGQLFLNLILNAVEAAGPGGWVDIQLIRTEKNRVRVQISDSGPGPTPEVAAQLFEPFVTGKPEGVGLGLAVAREIVLAHNGKIWWERDAEKTKFIVELPVEVVFQ